MHTANPYDLHDHTGARWLTPFLVVLAATILIAFGMLIYPYHGAY